MDEAGKYHSVRVEGLEESYEVLFPEEPTLTHADDHSITYQLDLEDMAGYIYSYPVRYVFSYIDWPEEGGYPTYELGLRNVEGRPYDRKIAASKYKKMRDDAAHMFLDRVASMAGQARNVAITELKSTTFPDRMGEERDYEITLLGKEGEQTDLRLRLVFTREGIYVIAMIGKGLNRFGQDRYWLPSWVTSWQPDGFPGPNWRYQGCPPWCQPRWILDYPHWPRSKGIRTPFEPTGGKLTIPWPRFRDWYLTWGKYGPYTFFDQAKIRLQGHKE